MGAERIQIPTDALKKMLKARAYEELSAQIWTSPEAVVDIESITMRENLNRLADEAWDDAAVILEIKEIDYFEAKTQFIRDVRAGRYPSASHDAEIAPAPSP